LTTKIAKSRKMMVNIDVDLYEAIRAEAFDARKSMSRVVNDAVRKHIGKRKPAKPIEPDMADGA
jgi:hypothetical protein